MWTSNKSQELKNNKNNNNKFLTHRTRCSRWKPLLYLVPKPIFVFNSHIAITRQLWGDFGFQFEILAIYAQHGIDIPCEPSINGWVKWRPRHFFALSLERCIFWPWMDWLPAWCRSRHLFFAHLSLHVTFQLCLINLRSCRYQMMHCNV